MNSLKGRLLLLFTVLMTILGIFATILFQDIKAFEEARAERELHSFVNAIHEKSKAVLRNAITTIEVLKNSEAFFENSCEDKLQKIKQDLRHYNVIGFIDSSGEVYCSSPSVTPKRQVADRKWFEQAYQTADLTVGEYQISRTTGETNLIVCTPVKRSGTGQTDLVAVGISLAWFSEFISTFDYSADIVGGIIDPGGQIIARFPDRDRWVGKRHPLTKDMHDALASSGGTIVAHLPDDIKRIWAFRRMDMQASPFLIYAAFPQSEWSLRVKTRVGISLGFLIVLFIITIGIGYAASHRWLQHPLKQAMEFSTRIADGNLDSGLSIGRYMPTEVKLLFRSLKHMQAQIIERTEMLRRSEALLNKAQRISHVGGWEYNVSTETMFWTAETYRIHDFVADDFEIGSKEHIARSLECYAEEDRPKMLSAFKRCLEKGEAYKLECRLTTAKGRRLWVLTMGQAVWENERIVRVVGNIQDITERKLHENKLMESEKQFRMLFENMNAGFVLFEPVIDAESIPIDLTIIAANKGFEETTGLDIQNATGKLLTKVLPGIEKDTTDWIGTYSTVALSGESKQFEASSELLGYYFTINAYQAGPNQCAVTFLDITNRKKADQKIKTALKEKETLLQEIYHRTKNNMQVIRSILFQNAKKYPSRDVADLVKNTETSIQSMSLVHQMLYQSKDLSRIDLHDYVHQLTKQIIQIHLISEAQIEISLNIEKNLILIDTAIPLGLVLNELIKNSIEHAFPEQNKGKLSIQILANDKQGFSMTVSDNGIGVPDGFEFRKQKTLGLKTVIGIVERQMEGVVEFDGQNGFICKIDFTKELYEERI